MLVNKHIIICDRCQKAEEESEEAPNLIIARYGALRAEDRSAINPMWLPIRLHDERIDLCTECQKELEIWVKGGR